MKTILDCNPSNTTDIGPHFHKWSFIQSIYSDSFCHSILIFVHQCHNKTACHWTQSFFAYTQYSCPLIKYLCSQLGASVHTVSCYVSNGQKRAAETKQSVAGKRSHFPKSLSLRLRRIILTAGCFTMKYVGLISELPFVRQQEMTHITKL